MKAELENLKSLNNYIEVIEEDEKVTILNPWKEDSLKIVLKNEHLNLIQHIEFREEYSAIFHTDTNRIEFIYGPLVDDDDDIDKKFKFNYMGKQFDCFFSDVSENLEVLAKSFLEIKHGSKSDYRNLRLLRDYYFKKNIFKEAFEYTKPISFYVQGDYKSITDFTAFTKTINFYLTYFKRDSAQIQLFKPTKTNEQVCEEEPCLSLFSEFPEQINAHTIDPILLDIFLVARETKNIRLKFIFYYQILEYASYYYLNNKLRSKLKTILTNPGLSSETNSASSQIIEEMKDHFSQHDDNIRLEQTVLEYCGINDVKQELNSNLLYFCSDQEFEGGLKINKLLKEQKALDYISDSDLQKVIKNISKIRNVLVHLRESRENKVILPTINNDELIRPYLYLVFRLAEKVAIQFSNASS